MRSTLSVRCAAAAMIVVLASISLLATPAEAESTLSTLTLPVDCNLGTDCFVQQMPDVDPGPLAIDPLCGDATYNGHDGWDFRVRSMVDVARGVPVVSVADGRVLRVRDGVPDRLVERNEEVPLLDGQECGNGVIVEHEGGLTSQYCHLKMGSVVVRPGMSLARGALLGHVGASGLAQFPHVHLAMRRNGAALEPLTGRFLADEEACASAASGLFTAPVRQLLEKPPHAILATGLSSVPPTLPDLVAGATPVAKTGGGATLAWVWAINLQKGDRFRIRIIHPDGKTLLAHETEPLPQRKANYIAYGGRRRPLAPGAYSVVVDLLHSGQTALTTTLAIRPDN